MRDPEVRICRMRGDLLVMEADEPDAAPDQRVEDRQITVAAHPKDDFNAQ
jgi:hypothetical protein